MEYLKQLSQPGGQQVIDAFVKSKVFQNINIIFLLNIGKRINSCNQKRH